MKKVMVTFGTRPEAIKMCPLVKELRSRGGIETAVCVSGQHREMLDQVLRCFDITPDTDLHIMREDQTLFDLTSGILTDMRDVLTDSAPDLLLVHGDTTTTFASALAAFYLGIPIGHVEAGLRTGDLSAPFPEEFNRRATSVVSRFNFAPTEAAKRNLLREGYPEQGIFVTGNTAIDALRTTVRDDYKHEILDWARGSRLIVLTAHRRENWGEPLMHIFRAVKRAVEARGDVKVIYPVHPNPAVKNAAAEAFEGCSRVRLVEPLDTVDFHNIVARSYLVLTDSGGIQEEAPSLNKPVLVLRRVTERDEGVAAGALKLVGTNEEDILREVGRLLDDRSEYDRMSAAENPYGDGFACRRIADIIERAALSGEF